MKQPLRPFEDMRAALLAAATPSPPSRRCPPPSPGRVLAVDQISGLDVPPLDNSSMDGYAVRCAGAPGWLRVAQRIPPAASATAWSRAPRRASSPARRCPTAPTPW